MAVTPSLQAVNTFLPKLPQQRSEETHEVFWGSGQVFQILKNNQVSHWLPAHPLGNPQSHLPALS